MEGYTSRNTIWIFSYILDMKYTRKIYGTVLVYTMVLVVLGVFMATVVLNVATELSLEYKIRNIEISLMDTIQTKWELAMKYARELNNTWSGFIDTIGCPTNFTMSGTVFRTTGISSDIRYLSWTILCKGVHNGNDIDFYFNSWSTDLEFAQYEGSQITINSLNTTGTFADSDSTFLDLTLSYPLLSDGIDDNFDSDNYSIYSTGAVYYPDGYVDNDAQSRLVNYGYVIEDSWLYSIFWSNKKMKDYIDNNLNNSDSIYTKLGNVSSGNLYLDINKSFRLILYRINPSNYEETWEFVISEKRIGTGELAWIGYLQDNLSLSAVKTGSEYNFDFTTHDYALFIENTSTGALLYRVSAEDSISGSGVYLNPLKDDDTSLFSYLGSHMFIDEEWKLIWSQFEVFGLK